MRTTHNKFAMSRRRKNVISAVAMAAALVFIWLDHSCISNKWQPQTQSAEEVKSSDFEKYHAKTFTVVKVVDGDTLDIDIPDGQYSHTRIRLLGIDAPETKNPQTAVMYFGQEASEFAKKTALGKPVSIYLDTVSPTRDKYSRLLAYIKLPGGTILNETLLTEGFAYADLRFRHSFYNRYKQLESIARISKKGLWQGVTREQMPEWLQREKPDLLRKK